MELDLEGEHADRSYALLVSLVTPRPIAWVTSLSLDGHLTPHRLAFSTRLGQIRRSSGFALATATTASRRIPHAMFVEHMNLWSIWSTKQWPRR
jgi:hypothetical protein